MFGRARVCVCGSVPHDIGLPWYSIDEVAEAVVVDSTSIFSLRLFFIASPDRKCISKIEIHSVRTDDGCSKSIHFTLLLDCLFAHACCCCSVCVYGVPCSVLRFTNMIALGLVVVVIVLPQNWVTAMTLLRINPMQTEDPLITMRAYAFAYPRVSGVVDTFGNQNILLRLPHTIPESTISVYSGIYTKLHQAKIRQHRTSAAEHQQFPEVNCKFWQYKMHFLLAFGRDIVFHLINLFLGHTFTLLT